MRTIWAFFLPLLLFAVPLRASAATWPVEDVARRVMPSVVGVLNVQGLPDGPSGPRGAGSGVIVRADGLIVTNYHVVVDASRIRVTLPDGKTVPASVVGLDPLTDLAVIKVGVSHLQPIRFADSSKLRIGQLAIAIGNPLGMNFQRTVTAGVVSGLNRSLGTGYAQRAYALIQTDAAINPGNSGGALVDQDGRLIGINSVKIAAPGFESMGFAIPANTVHQVIGDIVRHGRVPRPWLGLSVTLPGHGHQVGLLIQDVTTGGPAERAGLRAGDVITRIGGHSVKTVEDLYRILAEKKVGDDIAVRVQRGGSARDVTVRLRDLPFPIIRRAV